MNSHYLSNHLKGQSPSGLKVKYLDPSIKMLSGGKAHRAGAR